MLSSCAGTKVYNQRTSGVSGKSGSNVVYKTQSTQNFEKAMQRTDLDHIYVFGIKLPSFGLK